MPQNALTIQGLTKTYASGTQALKGVNLEVKSGDFFGLLGANGAGKTTIIGILTGLVNKTGGSAKIFSHDIEKETNQAKKMVGVVPQEFNFSIWEKVIDIVVQQAGYFGVPRKIAMERAEKVLTALDLWGKRNQISRNLSGGMKRRLMIARALIHEPKLLFLDEPTAGVDVELRYGMWKYLNALNANGVTIFLTTHYLEEAEQLCRNVAIIKEGEIVRQGSVKSLIRSLEKQTYILNIERIPAKQGIPGNKLESKTHLKIGSYDLKFIDEATVETDLNSKDNIGDLIHTIYQHGLITKDIRPKGNRLEQLFLNIIRK